MKLKTTNYKKCPCENCADGIYMTVEAMWWCDKHLMYACQMERNCLCEKFERDGEQADGGRQAVLDMVTASNEKNHKMREFIKKIEEEINSPNRGTCDYFIVDRIEEILDKYKSEIASKSEQESLAIERYRDLVDYFNDEDVSRKIVRDFQATIADSIRNGEPFSDEVAPKKCHNENPDYADCDQFVCSNCGIELQDWHQVEREDDGDITYHEYEFRFCPNCGAKLEV